jgi:hypothetical protein
MRLGRLAADATIVFDGGVDVASKPVARLDLRDTALRRGPSARSSTSPYSLTMPDQVSNI